MHAVDCYKASTPCKFLNKTASNLGERTKSHHTNHRWCTWAVAICQLGCATGRVDRRQLLPAVALNSPEDSAWANIQWHCHDM